MRSDRLFVATGYVRSQLAEQRSHRFRHHWRRLMLLGLVTSLVVHGLFMLILNSIHRRSPSGSVPEPAPYEFAILLDEELTRLEHTAPEAMDTVAVVEAEAYPEESAELSPDIPDADLGITTDEAMPILIGSGSIEFPSGGVTPAPGSSVSGSDEGLTPRSESGGTSFFGVTARGSRFAYIVDMSGSMRVGKKMDRAKRELADSIRELPASARFFVLVFASTIDMPPNQIGWMTADENTVTRVVEWIFGDIDPWGPTKARPAFQVVFDLDKIGGRPDVIFFLTDGKITDITAEEIIALNEQGDPVVINTFAFGDPIGHRLLRKIAAETGGQYQFVSTQSK